MTCSSAHELFIRNRKKAKKKKKKKKANIGLKPRKWWKTSASEFIISCQPSILCPIFVMNNWITRNRSSVVNQDDSKWSPTSDSNNCATWLQFIQSRKNQRRFSALRNICNAKTLFAWLFWFALLFFFVMLMDRVRSSVTDDQIELDSINYTFRIDSIRVWRQYIKIKWKNSNKTKK